MGTATELAKQQRRALARLSELPETGELVLVGGTALAHHLEHRLSLDLDLFGNATLDVGRLHDAIVSAFPDAEVIARTDVALQFRMENTPVDIVRYRYPLLEAAPPGPEGVAIASVRDLGAMKLAAIGKRGLRRDFWDLYAITKEHRTLKLVATDYLEKFGKAESDLYHVARSLTYFDDAEHASRFPAGLSDELWSQIQAYFRAEAGTLLED